MGRDPIEGNCRLCGQLRPLRNSHIIPKWCYETTFDEKHRAVRVHLSGEALRRGRQSSYVFDGVKERLLCEDCEQLLSPYEDYVQQVVNGGPLASGVSWISPQQMSGIDYKKLKLFQMSVLWRAGVSKQFASVQLGPHEEKLRRLVLAEDPAEPQQYGCIMSLITPPPEEDPDISKELVAGPLVTRFKGGRFYSFPFTGILWTYSVASHPPPHPIAQAFAQPDGTVRIMRRGYLEVLQQCLEGVAAR